MTPKKKLCIAGKNRIAVEVLNLAVDSELFDLFACPVRSDQGVDTWQPSLLRAARSHQINAVPLSEIYEVDDIIFLSLEFDRIIDVSRFRNAVLLNVHFSLLPAYKGCFTSIWPIYYGEVKTGVTLHAIDHGIDTGPILDQIVLPIGGETDARQLYELYQDAGLRIVERNLCCMANKVLTATAQPAERSTYFARSSLSRLNQEIDFSATAYQIQTFVRALFFPEYQTATCFGVRIQKCNILDSRSLCKPGAILVDDDDRFRVSTVDFDVDLIKFRSRSNT